MATHSKELREVLLFILEIFACIFIIGMFTCIMALVSASNKDSYTASLSLKKELLKNSPSPRIVIVGGSGTTAGINSEALFRETGYHPVNMGLFAGLGMRILLRQVENNVRPGDIVLVVPEHELLQQPLYGDGYLVLKTLQYNRGELSNILYPHTLIVMLRAFPSWLSFITDESAKRVYRLFVTTDDTFSEKLYRISNMNQYGDLDTPLSSTTRLTSNDIARGSIDFVRPAPDPAVMTLLQGFIARVEQRHVQVYVVSPTTPQTVFTHNAASITSSAAVLEASIGAAHSIGSPNDFIYPDSDFLDSLAHLTTAGKNKRTKRIIELLRQKPQYHAYASSTVVTPF